MMIGEQECSFKRKYTEEGTIQKENKSRVAWCQKKYELKYFNYDICIATDIMEFFLNFYTFT